MKYIDLNADIGEAESPEGIQAETDILNYVSSANIACGGHAGDAESMRRTVINAGEKGVVIGAHPAYPDRVNFGRSSNVLGQDISASDLKQTLMQQIISLVEIAAEEGHEVKYIKPHGALYNDAVTSREHADVIADVISELDQNLILLGGPDSEMSRSTTAAGLAFVTEGFIDRRYTDDGHLLSRKIEGAVIKDQNARMAQTKALVTSRQVDTYSGQTIRINAQSLCLHGDSSGAVDTARRARRAIESCGVTIRSFI